MQAREDIHRCIPELTPESGSLIALACLSSYNHRDRSVYRDRYGNYHRYETRNNHRGYWHQNNGIRFWVNLF